MPDYNPRNPKRDDPLPLSSSLEPTLEGAHVSQTGTRFSGRRIFFAAISLILGVVAGFIAQGLIGLIGLITNISFHGIFSLSFSSPAGNNLGPMVIVVPIVGGLIVGLMARYGSSAIRGHGIPEAMEQVLQNESRIPPRLTFLKPISAAIAIGTGGPFGAEGPIIATGGALGSFLGQAMKTTADERKTFLAAGAAAGMAATFGSPISAILLSVELLLFEYSPSSIVPVALASASATAVRALYRGTAPIFQFPALPLPGFPALAGCLVLGVMIGVCAVFATRAVYWVEDLFERLPIHWMWWPAIGGVAVGLIGYAFPKTLGVGYDNIESILGASLVGRALIFLFVFKFLSWTIALGSGTSGGTLAPLLTIGGGLGSALGAAMASLVPSLGLDVRVAALVGMAAMFAAASRALLASIVFAFETTLQPTGLLPLLLGCGAAYLVASFMMKNSIMTEKIARRGIHVPTEYIADYLQSIPARDVATFDVVTLDSDRSLESARTWISSGVPGTSHQGYPVVDKHGHLLGVVTRRDLFQSGRQPTETLSELLRRPATVIFEDDSLRTALDTMAEHHVGRIPLVSRQHPNQIVGILSRSDIIAAHHLWLQRTRKKHKGISLRPKHRPRKAATS